MYKKRNHLGIHDQLQLREERLQSRRRVLDALSELGQKMQVKAV